MQRYDKTFIRPKFSQKNPGLLQSTRGMTPAQLADSEWNELEQRVAAIPVVGDRYNAEQQKQVGH